MSVGKAIRDLRKANEWTQDDLTAEFNAAEPLDLQTTRYDVSKYERGITTPPGDKLLKFLALKNR